MLKHMQMEETKKCKSCGDILPLSAFRLTKTGGRTDTCKECIADARNNSLKLNRLGGGGNLSRLPFTTRTSTASSPSRSYSL